MRRDWPGAGRRATGVVVGAVVLGAALAMSVPGMAQAADQPMTADTVASLPQLPVTLGVPADGRVNGYRFAAQVLGAATGTTVPGAAGPRAEPGQRLYVFGLRWQADVDSQGNAAQIQATVVADGARTAVPIAQASASDGQAGPADSGPEYFIASVSATAADVVVELANDGFAQDFSLTHMAREGSQPAALYRSVSGWEMTDAVNATVALPTSFNAGGNGSADPDLHLALPVATLSEFGPQGATQPAPAGQAWLVPELADPYNPNNIGEFSVAEFLTPVPPSSLTLVLPGKPPIAAQAFPGGPDAIGASVSDGHDALFPDIYAFQVPSDLTTATLDVVPGTQMVTAGGSGLPDVPIAVPSTSFDLTFPAATPPPPPAGAVDHPLAFRPDLATAAGTPSRHGSGGGFPIWLLLIGLAVVAVAGSFPLLKRRGLIPHTGSGPTGPPPTVAAPPPPVQSWPTATPPTQAPPTTRAQAETRPVLLEPPAGLPGRQEGRARVLLLGRPLFEGMDEVTNETMLEIVALLAAHPGRSFSSDELRSRLAGSKDSRPISADTLRRYMTELRRILGADILPAATDGRGYQIVGLSTDLAAFNQAVSAAQAVTNPAKRASLLADALVWVREAPFAHASGAGYDWALDDPELTTRLTERIQTAAADLADLAIAAGDARLARWAAHQGLRVERTHQTLMLPLFHAAALDSRLQVVWDEIVADLRRHGEQPGPELTALYGQLRGEKG